MTADWVVGRPPGLSTPEADTAWSPDDLDVGPPTEVVTLDDLGDDPAARLSPLAIAGPFPVLGPDGTARVRAIADELEASARGDERVRRHRGLVYRSAYLRGLAADPTLLAHLSSLCDVDVAPHPVSHHSMQLNYPPPAVGQRIDAWHHDVVAFALVVLVTDPAEADGGEFEWFAGPRADGEAALAAGGLAEESVRSVAFPAAGWGFVMQGHRLLHRAAPLRGPGRRMTLVGSYWAPDAPGRDPGDLDAIRRADGIDVALREWARYRAVQAATRLTRFAETSTGFDRPLADVQADLCAALADAAAAVAAFDDDSTGRLIVLDP